MEVLANNKPTINLNEFVLTRAHFNLEKIKEGSIILLDKPLGWSSFKLVKKIKYLTKANRVGHAGTLDPLATGLLIIATGKCTKMIELVQNQYKIYTGCITFGTTTASYDLESALEGNFDYSQIKNNELSQAAIHFTGIVTQTPPSFSAIKINGTRAYKMARQGIEPEIKSREITIDYFNIHGELPNIQFEVKCSKGTYIRTLANDFGKFLNSGSHLSALRRTQIGDFNIENAFSIEEFSDFIAKEK